jgi:hypothetical protein
MVFPAIKLNKLYSLNLYEEIDIIFEDLSILDIDSLKEVVSRKKFGNISIVKNSVSINTDTKIIKIIGYKINNSSYIVNREGNGDINVAMYKCSDENILTAIEYLYHMYRVLVKGA